MILSVRPTIGADAGGLVYTNNADAIAITHEAATASATRERLRRLIFACQASAAISSTRSYAAVGGSLRRPADRSSCAITSRSLAPTSCSGWSVMATSWQPEGVGGAGGGHDCLAKRGARASEERLGGLGADMQMIGNILDRHS